MADGLSTGDLVDGRYEVLEGLGEGGMGRVYRARDLRLDRVVALKVLHEHLAQTPAEVQRFLREARLASRVSHPNVLAVYAAEEGDGQPYLAEELVEGRSLAAELAAGMGPREGLEVLVQVARALAAAHDAGLVHRDLKPENVLVGPRRGTEPRVVKVVDWGIARATDVPGTLTATGVIIGTPGYMAPEQITGGRVGPATDLYALGATLHLVVTGRLPFPSGELMASLQAHLRQLPPRLDRLAPGTPRALADLASALLAKAPGERPASAAEVADRLASLVEAVPDRRGPVAPSCPKSPAPRRAPTAALAALLVALAAGAVVATRPGGRDAPPVEPTPFTVLGARLSALDALALEVAGEPAPGTELRVTPRARRQSPFQVPIPPRAAAERGRRRLAVALGRGLATSATLEVLGAAGQPVTTFVVRLEDLPPLAAVARLQGSALEHLLDAMRGDVDRAGELLADRDLPPAATESLRSLVPALLPPGTYANDPTALLLQPLLFLEVVRSPRGHYVPPWGSLMRRLVLGWVGHQDLGIWNGALGRPLGEVVVSPAQSWLFTPDQVAAARRDPDTYVVLANKGFAMLGLDRLTADTWRAEQVLVLPLPPRPWPPARARLVLELRFMTDEAAVLLSFNGRPPYPLFLSGARPPEDLPGESLTRPRGLVAAVDPADLKPGENLVTVRLRRLTTSRSTLGVRLQRLWLLDPDARSAPPPNPPAE